jgi:hypothetical protein
MTNQDIDQFILENLPNTFSKLDVLATKHFNQDAFRKVDARLQALRKRDLITFDRIKGQGTVWRLKP